MDAERRERVKQYNELSRAVQAKSKELNALEDEIHYCMDSPLANRRLRTITLQERAIKLDDWLREKRNELQTLRNTLYGEN